MLTHLDEVVDDIVDALCSEVPTYRRLNETGLENLRQDLARHVQSFVSTVAEGRPLSQADLDALAALSRRRLAGGIPLQDLLRAHEIGAQVALRHFLAALEECPSPLVVGVTPQATETALQVARQVRDAIADACGANDGHDLRVRRLGGRAALDELLDPSTPNDQAWRAARELGVPLSEPIAVAAIGCAPEVGGGPVTTPAEPVAEFKAALGDSLPGAVVAVHEGLLVCLVPGSVADEPLVTAFGAMLRRVGASDGCRRLVGIGSAGVGQAALLRGLTEAVQVLSLVGAAPRLPAVMSFGRTIHCRALSQCPGLWEEVQRRVIEPLRHAPVLLATLEAVVDALGNHTLAAGRLGVTRKTVLSRLEKVQMRTGLTLTDPRNFAYSVMAMDGLRLVAPE